MVSQEGHTLVRLQAYIYWKFSLDRAQVVPVYYCFML